MNTSNIQKTKAAEKIRFIKTSIDDFLTKIEQEILADLETKHSKLDLKMNRLLQQLEHQANQIDKWLSGFSEMTRFATELQMYVGLLEIEIVTSEADKYIEDLKNGKHLDENNLEVTISSSLQSILKDVKELGKVDIKSSPSTLRIKAGRKDQAQDLVRLVPRIEEIKPIILRTLIIPKGMDIANVFACIILPDGRFIILDNHDVDGQLLLFSNDGMFIRQVSTFPGESYDACFVKNNTVAVLFGSSNEITLVDIEKNEITDKIKLPGFSGSIACDGQVLVTSAEGCSIVNLNDMSHTALNFQIDEIALFKGNIYGTYYSKIYCYKSTGEVLWELQHQDIVQPIGIELDVNGFIYIVSNGNDSIVVVSPDGKTCKTILFFFV
ncbi:Hypothetical predicted protein [Mytilus galloprovincialis]|uniref:Uncharacterized protein n=1 Tax=Mytilus galloprovincialis TaxID=29158 RepID=A0A8B6DFI1_MYTGA|nr:Hypothetical predicted protein [Mytilus galloprovincialis]